MTPRFCRQAIPLVGTLGKGEAEVAAAVVLLALHELGRDWAAPVAQQEIDTVLSAALKAEREPISTWARNPFLLPDFDELVRRGFAVCGAGSLGATLALTPAALERLAKHLELLE